MARRPGKGGDNGTSSEGPESKEETDKWGSGLPSPFVMRLSGYHRRHPNPTYATQQSGVSRF